MSSVALYTLTSQYLELAERLANMDLDAQTVADTIEASGITDEIAVKAQGIEFVARTAEMHCPAIDAEIARLQDLKSQRQRVAQGLRDYLKTNMEGAGIDKIECPLFKFSIRKNPVSVEVFDANQIPAELWTTPAPKPPVPHPNKAEIKALLSSGKDVPGARITQWTRLVVA